MDDLAFGTRNKRGDWAPKDTLEIAPFWRKPFSLGGILAWIPGYLFPWNAFHMATALLYWFYVVPDVEVMKTLGWGWALWLYAVNAGAIFLMYGAIELFWYVKRKQGTRFKYNAKFPSDQPSDVFWFKSQNIDNFARSFFISIPYPVSSLSSTRSDARWSCATTSWSKQTASGPRSTRMNAEPTMAHASAVFRRFCIFPRIFIIRN